MDNRLGKGKDPDEPSGKDDLEEKFEMNEARSGEFEMTGNPPGDEIDINHDNINEAEAAAAAPDAVVIPAAVAPPLGDEIDVMEDHVLPPPVIDFHQLDNALQHVQGHMDSMMHNLGGLQVGALWGDWGGRRMLAIKSIGLLATLTALSSQIGI